MKISLIMSISLVWATVACALEKNDALAPDTIDLGVVSEGESKEFSVPLKNVTKTKIVVDRVFHTCDCFKSMDKAPVQVPPEASVKFRFKLDASKLKGGKNSKTIWVKSGGDLFKVVVKMDVREKSKSNVKEDDLKRK